MRWCMCTSCPCPAWNRRWRPTTCRPRRTSLIRPREAPGESATTLSATTLSDSATPASSAAEARLEGKRFTGWLSSVWRLPFGFGALLAGLLVDRFGPRPMLVLYLFGCGAACVLVALAPPEWLLFVLMFVMGSFASIYHPAGLAMISRETPTSVLPKALGVHGVFGSAGIAAAPFALGAILSVGGGWQAFYLVLAAPGILLASAMWRLNRGQQRRARDREAAALADPLRSLEPPAATLSQGRDAADAVAAAEVDDAERADWPAFALVTCMTLLQGFVYAGVMSFLRRYLSGAAEGQMQIVASQSTGAVLILGCVGQFLAAHWARPKIMEWQLAVVILANAPLLAWMAFADSAWTRLAAAGCFSIVHFMYQPLYNALVAKYTPRSRRSTCYGVSFAMSFGLGGLGAAFVGWQPLQQAYLSLSRGRVVQRRDRGDPGSPNGRVIRLAAPPEAAWTLP